MALAWGSGHSNKVDEWVHVLAFAVDIEIAVNQFGVLGFGHSGDGVVDLQLGTPIFGGSS